MTLQTWKDEFYPEEPRKRMTKRQSIEHSIRKWEGLTIENLKKHKLIRDGRTLLEKKKGWAGDWFSVNGDSCALCEKYFESGLCNKCPLYKHLDNYSCDSGLLGNKSPYVIWHRTGNPVPMINALKELLK